MASRLRAHLPRVAFFVLLGLAATATLTYAAGRRPASTPAASTTAAPNPPLVVPDVRNQAYVFAKGALADAGFAWPVYRWARGESLEKVLTAAEANGQELSAGDFVRWSRQVIDLLDQIRDVLGKADPVGATAAEAVKALRRGVVAAGAA